MKRKLMMMNDDRSVDDSVDHSRAPSLAHYRPATFSDAGALLVRVVHLGRSTCHAISGRGDESTSPICFQI